MKSNLGSFYTRQKGSHVIFLIPLYSCFIGGEFPKFKSSERQVKLNALYLVKDERESLIDTQFCLVNNSYLYSLTKENKLMKFDITGEQSNQIEYLTLEATHKEEKENFVGFTQALS